MQLTKPQSEPKRVATANSDTLKPALIIDSTSLSAARTYHVGDTVNFTLYFHSVFPDRCFFVINIEGGLRLIDSAGQLTPSINEYLQLDTGAQSKTYLLYVQDFNPSTKSYRKIIANLYNLNGQKIFNLLDADNVKSRIEVDISFINTLQLANQIFIIGFTLVDEESNINYVAKKIIFK